MLSWIIALVLALAAFSALAAWIWMANRRQRETQRGLAGLAGVHWRDFSHIVQRALQEKRGMSMASSGDAAADSEPSSDWLMSLDGQQVLVSCKHGMAYRIGAAAVNELGAKSRLAGARRSLLITEGLVEQEGLDGAAKQSIEVLDGRLLWPLLREYAPPEVEASAITTSRTEAALHTGIAALASITLGLAVGMGHLSLGLNQDSQPAVAGSSEASVPAAVAAAPAPAATVQAPGQVPVQAAAAGQNAAVTAAAPGELDTSIQDPDPETLKRYQQQVSRILSSTEGLSSAIWMTRMTMTVERQIDDAQAWAVICPVMHRYPSLRTVRVQLNPRHGVDEPVRWRQCSTI